MVRFENFDGWFKAIMDIQLQYPIAVGQRHPNQTTYDLTLKDNYRWPYHCLPPVDVDVRQALPNTVKPLLYDIGCAYGSVAIGANLLGYDVKAWDITQEYVNLKALSDRGISFEQLNIECDHPERRAHVIVFTEVLEHLNSNPRRAINRLHRSLVCGGKLILSTPRAEDGRHESGVYQRDHGLKHWQEIPEFSREREWMDAHMYVYPSWQVNELLISCGFQIVNTALAWDGMSYCVEAIRI